MEVDYIIIYIQGIAAVKYMARFGELLQDTQYVFCPRDGRVVVEVTSICLECVGVLLSLIYYTSRAADEI